MEKNAVKGSLLIMFVLIVEFTCVGSLIESFLSYNSIGSSGLINYWPQVNITANTNTIIGTNNLSLGFTLGSDWKSWCNDANRTQLAQDARFKVIRFGSIGIEPCTYWNESARTGIFNWTEIDSLMKKIFEINAEPLITIGFYSWENDCMLVPHGMAINASTNLPYPKSFAAYAAEWVKHFKAINLPVLYYEIINEPHHYFGWNALNATKLAYYVELWNNTARMMRYENPQILLSHDSITEQRVLDYWLQHGDDIDYLDFHKYDSDELAEYDDVELLNRAEQLFFETTPTIYGVREAQKIWLNARGKLLPVIDGESNLDSAYMDGTDPRIQQVIGAVWAALVLRTAIIKGLSISVYNTFSSSASWAFRHTSSGGLGFGMINSDDDQPWLPYYVHKLIGSNLESKDNLFQVESSSTDISVLAWCNRGKSNLLIISKVNEPRTLQLKGLVGPMIFSKIDNSTPWNKPCLQEGNIDPKDAFMVNGYAIMLLRSS
jgi:hypothetical protein